MALATLHGYHVVFLDGGITLAAAAIIAGLLLRRGPAHAQAPLLSPERVDGEELDLDRVAPSATGAADLLL